MMAFNGEYPSSVRSNRPRTVSSASEAPEHWAAEIPVSAVTYNAADGWHYRRGATPFSAHSAAQPAPRGWHSHRDEAFSSGHPAAAAVGTAEGEWADQVPWKGGAASGNWQDQTIYQAASEVSDSTINLAATRHSTHDPEQEDSQPVEPNQPTDLGIQNAEAVSPPPAVYSPPQDRRQHEAPGRDGYWQPVQLGATTTATAHNTPAAAAANPVPAQMYLDPMGTIWARHGSRESMVYDINALQQPAFLRTPYMPDFAGSSPFGSPAPTPGVVGGQVVELAPEPEAVFPITIEPHPRASLAVWRWRAVLLANNLLLLIAGYDVGNAANIQASVCGAFGGGHRPEPELLLLPWVGLAYFLANAAAIPLARKLCRFCDPKPVTAAALGLGLAGTALSGAAPHGLAGLVAGRALVGVGASFAYQGISSFNAAFSYPHEIGSMQVSLDASFAVGMLGGPIIGGALAQSPHATWRWSFYLQLPFCSLALALLLLIQPRYRYRAPSTPLSAHLRRLDWLGNALHVAALALLGAALVPPFSSSSFLSSSSSSSSSGPAAAAALWAVVAGLVAAAYAAQQALSLGATPARRIFPFLTTKTPLTPRTQRLVALAALCTFAGGLALGAVLYCVPPYFAFTTTTSTTISTTTTTTTTTNGTTPSSSPYSSPLASGARLLPFTAALLTALLLVSAAPLLLVAPLRRRRRRRAASAAVHHHHHQFLFAAGGVLLLVGGGVLRVLIPPLPTHHPSAAARIMMGAETLVGAGVGLVWQLAVPVCAAALRRRAHASASVLTATPPAAPANDNDDDDDHDGGQDDQDQLRLDASALVNLAQMSGAALGPAVAAAAYYRGVGPRVVRAAVSAAGYDSDLSDAAVRQLLLAGAAWPVLGDLQAPLLVLLDAAGRALVACLSPVVLAAGALCLVAACCLPREAQLPLRLRGRGRSSGVVEESPGPVQQQQVEVLVK
ncbi:major facilitator superfamily domain-containing protein [Xylariaceae sp. FL0804]|nr:major facilitator superfamily domain-containing protein [Xylariaceae sp. FL0804]